jgi:hypothetical protein
VDEILLDPQERNRREIELRLAKGVADRSPKKQQ